ncbi:methyltransferase domain-containing protein [Streptomyces sp. NPDC051940]|uniref:SAM-dependent methyltransferase n=1 Tax=Streptomyces sp. NPDC051940 TaxID=3155675 RepID=UPI0034306C0C
MDRNIRTVEDVLELLDGLFAQGADRWSEDGGADWWDGFYGDRARPVPFFAAKPDENLAEYVASGTLTPGGRVLELGCGPGRNAVYLAGRDFTVDAVDLSAEAIRWGRERAEEAGVADRVRFLHGDAFALDGVEGPYDLVFDSGCFHHLPPHRRITYLALLDRVLAPGGHFGLTCFRSGGMGSELPDVAFYGDGHLHGGLAYSADALRGIFAGLEERELRRMRPQGPESDRFGEAFLWAALFRRP